MKKVLIKLLIIIILLSIGQSFVYAENEINIQQDMKDIYQETGLKEIISKYAIDSQVEEEIQELLDDDIITSSKKIINLSPKNIINSLWLKIKKNIQEPIKLSIGVLAIVLVTALMEMLKECFSNNSTNEIINSISIISVFITIAYPILQCIRSGIDTIVNISNFMIGFIPVYSGIMTTCGKIFTGAVYNSFLFCFCQVISQIISSKILPVMNIYMAFCLVSSLTPHLNISNAAKTVKNVITWVLGFIISAFVGLITIQGIVASSADTVGTKTAKFVIGSAVPIIGSVVSDAYLSVKACFDFLRSSVGAISIIFIVMSFLPILIKLTVWMLTIKLSSGIAEFVGVKQVAEILKSSSYVISLLFAIIVCYILLIVITTTVMIILGLG